MGIKLKIIAGLSVFALAGSLTFWAHIERGAKQRAQERASSALDEVARLERSAKVQQALNDSIFLIDSIQTERLSNAQAQIDTLRSRVADGAIGLRIDADCPSPGLPDTPDASLDSGAGPRLTDAAERHYWDLRNGIERVNAQLMACQDILREIKKSPHAEG